MLPDVFFRNTKLFSVHLLTAELRQLFCWKNLICGVAGTVINILDLLALFKGMYIDILHFSVGAGMGGGGGGKADIFAEPVCANNV